MSEDFKPVSDDQGNEPLPDVSETAFMDGTDAVHANPVDEAAVEQLPEQVVLVEEVVEVPTLKVRPPQPSLWAQLQRLLVGDRDSLSRQIDDLTRAVEASPDAPANYVLRGELYLDSREYELALADFERGVELADAQFEDSDWGIIAQAMRDRALVGLQKAARKLGKRSTA